MHVGYVICNAGVLYYIEWESEDHDDDANAEWRKWELYIFASLHANIILIILPYYIRF